MRTLFILRHAKSSWKDANLSDFDRPLNARGERDAPIMATRMREAGHRPDLIVSSRARRALETARVFADTLELDPGALRDTEALYLARVADMIELIRSAADDCERLMIVGHNPGLTTLINTLGRVELDTLPTCGVFCLQFDIDRWQDLDPASPGDVTWYDLPRNAR